MPLRKLKELANRFKLKKDSDSKREGGASKAGKPSSTALEAVDEFTHFESMLHSTLSKLKLDSRFGEDKTTRIMNAFSDFFYRSPLKGNRKELKKKIVNIIDSDVENRPPMVRRNIGNTAEEIIVEFQKHLDAEAKKRESE